MTHEELTKEQNEDRHKKKSIALKSSIRAKEDSEEEDSGSDVDIALITQSFKRFLKNKQMRRRSFNNPKKIFQQSEENLSTIRRRTTRRKPQLQMTTSHAMSAKSPDISNRIIHFSKRRKPTRRH
jgi:hypothetical protein